MLRDMKSQRLANDCPKYAVWLALSCHHQDVLTQPGSGSVVVREGWGFKLTYNADTKPLVKQQGTLITKMS